MCLCTQYMFNNISYYDDLFSEDMSLVPVCRLYMRFLSKC